MNTAENIQVAAPGRDDWFEALPPPTFTDEAFVEHEALFEDSHLCVTAARFRGATLRAAVAGIALDLREARIAPGGATISLDVSLSGVEILVLPEWDVVLEVTSICAQVRTERARPPGRPGRPRLLLIGTVAAGALYVRAAQRGARNTSIAPVTTPAIDSP
jgi:hypothetical protein